MLQYYIDYTKKPRKIRLYLLNSKGKTLCELTEDTFNKKQTLIFGGINRFSFTVPYTVDIEFQKKRNPLIKKFTKKNYVKVTVDEIDYEEIYAITKKGKSDNDSSVYNIDCFSRGYDLRKFKMIGYEVVSYSPEEVLNDTLKGTGWTIGYINPTLAEKKRGFTVSSKTCLEFMEEIKDTYKGIITYDTINKKVNLYTEEELSVYKGFWVSNRQYIQNFEETIDEDEIITRLYIKGKDDLTINGVNPTGQRYIDDFTYFYDVMSDELRDALAKYNSKLSNESTSLSGLLAQKKTLQEQLTEQQNKLSELNTEKQIILDNIATSGEESNTDLIKQRDDKIAEITTQESLISATESSIKGFEEQATSISTSLSYEANLTSELLEELQDFIFIDEWSDSNITDEQTLYDEGKKYLTEHNAPSINISMGLIPFFNIIEEQHNWDRFNIGDIIRVEHDEFGTFVDAKVQEIVIDYENPNISVTVSNVKRVADNLEEWIKEQFYDNSQIKNDYKYYKDQIAIAVSNFNSRNDRISTPPVYPTFKNDGSDIIHTNNDDGSVNITVSWQYPNFEETQNSAHNIDGFEVFLYTSASNEIYVFGSTLASEEKITVPYTTRTLAFNSKAANKYHSFGIRAYRTVDPDVNSSRIIYSPIMSFPESPYKPMDEVAMIGSLEGALAGTVNGIGYYSGETPPENPQENYEWTNTSLSTPEKFIYKNNEWVSFSRATSDIQGYFTNIKNIGATGGGILIDDIAIQNGLNIARDQGSVRLYFPKGTYCISTPFRLYKNTIIELHPEAILLRVGGVAHNKIFINGEQGNNSYAYGYNGEGNIHFIGGTIDLNTENFPLNTINSNTSAFDLSHGENISFTDLTIKNGQNGHYFQISSCKNVRFNNCKLGFVRYTADTGSYNYELIQIEVASSTSFPTFGGYDLSISRDITIENCTFENVIRAIGTHGDGMYETGNIVYCENIRIMNNNFINSLDNMLNFTGYKNVVFENNIISNVGSYGMYIRSIIDSIFKDNTFENIQKSAILTGYNTDNNRFVGNKYKEICLSQTGSYSAIRLDSSNNNIFDNETVYGEVVNYAYVMFASLSAGNKVINHNFKSGLNGKITGTLEPYVTIDCVTLGDSIVQGGDTYGYFQDTMLTLTPKIDKHFNRGYNGYTAGISSNTSYHSINEIMSSVETAGLYLVWLGTNDFSRNIPIGTIDDEVGQIDSFYGGLKQIYVSLTDKNMSATIIFLTPMKRDNASSGGLNWDTANSAGFTLSDYVNAIKLFCERYACATIDMFNESGVSNRTIPTLLYDGLHPNQALNIRIGKIVGNRVNQYI